jgi:hypothetical protein
VPSVAPAGLAETARERFARTLPWTVLATNDFAGGVDRVPKRVAIRRREIAPDPPGWLTALRFDVDGADASTRWLDAGLPPPNLIVRRRSTGHAHLIYLLGVWVRTDGQRGWREIRFASVVDRGMTAALGADIAYSARFQHNPLDDEAWDVREVRAEPYSLAELAQHVDLETPARSAPTSSGLGRNVAVFDRLRRWAYRAIAEYAKRRRDEWDHAVACKAREIAIDVRAEYGEIVGGHSYRDSEVRATSRSVAKWTWQRYVADVPPALFEARAIVEAEKARIRAERARRTRGETPRALYLATASKRRSGATQMRESGIPVRTIAAKLGVSVREIYRLLSTAVKGMLADPIVQGPSRAQTLCGPGLPDTVADQPFVEELLPQTDVGQAEDAVSRRLERGSPSVARTGEAGGEPLLDRDGGSGEGIVASLPFGAYIRRRVDVLLGRRQHPNPSSAEEERPSV